MPYKDIEVKRAYQRAYNKLHMTGRRSKHRTARRVLAIKLGRALLDTEEAHHIDEDWANNDPANLEALTRPQHAKVHAKWDVPQSQRPYHKAYMRVYNREYKQKRKAACGSRGEII